MSGSYWHDALAADMAVPDDRPLPDLTAELTRMLGDPDPTIRDELAFPMLATWIQRGVYDDLLTGLGDGMAAGLRVGLGDVGTDSVFRRSFSALVLTRCLDRDLTRSLLTPSQVLVWGDRLITWLLRERDLRGFVPGKGWAHAVAHGADAIGTLAASQHLDAPELTALLDVVADRVLSPTPHRYVHEEPDRLATAALAVVRRDLVPMTVLEPWVERVAATARGRWGSSGPGDPFEVRSNAEALLRALHLQLALGADPPAARSDLLLVLVDALRSTNPHSLRR